jgi:hypothetical protein
MLIVSYTDIDFTKTELRQRTSKTCEIELEARGEKIVVRQPASKKGDEVVSIIKKTLEDNKGISVEHEKLSLENITLAEARSYFFGCLIDLIDEYRLEDVTSIDVYHNIDENSDEDEITDSIVSNIKKAALSGDGVLISDELRQLHEKGFFITKIVWKSIDKLNKGDMVEFEALFGDPLSCSDFKYLVRGIYNYNEKSGNHNVTRRVASRIEVDVLTRKLEEASKNAYIQVINKYTET